MKTGQSNTQGHPPLEGIDISPDLRRAIETRPLPSPNAQARQRILSVAEEQSLHRRPLLLPSRLAWAASVAAILMVSAFVWKRLDTNTPQNGDRAIAHGKSASMAGGAPVELDVDTRLAAARAKLARRESWSSTASRASAHVDRRMSQARYRAQQLRVRSMIRVGGKLESRPARSRDAPTGFLPPRPRPTGLPALVWREGTRMG